MDNPEEITRAIERLLLSAPTYDHDRELRMAAEILHALPGKVIGGARVTGKHIALETTDGWAYRFYGFIEAVPPGGPSLYDPPEG